MVHKHAFSVACLVLMLAPAASGIAAGIPGGILDENEKTAYLARDGGIDAVGLARGELLWTTTKAQAPLLVLGDRLYGLALDESNMLFVRGFDLANNGKLSYQSERIELPRWVVTHNGPRQSFQWNRRLEKTVLLFNWRAAAWAETGPRKEAAGEVRIDLQSGAVKLQETNVSAIRPPVPMPERIAGLAVRWHRVIGGQIQGLVLDEAPDDKGNGRQRFVLRNWNEETGKEGTSHELMRGNRLTVLAGLDGSHLWLRDAAPSPDEAVYRAGREAAYQWMVFSALDGHLVARVPFLPGTQQATLIGDRAYFLTSAPLRDPKGEWTRRLYSLFAVEVQTGKTRWQRTLSSEALAR